MWKRSSGQIFAERLFRLGGALLQAQNSLGDRSSCPIVALSSKEGEVKFMTRRLSEP